MSYDPAIRTEHLAKAFKLFARKEDRLKQVVLGWARTYYRPYWVLRDISLEVRRGECVGILGRNGSGKSTLVKILCGIVRPSSGTMAINGRVAPVLALGAMFDWELSGRENALISATVLGLRRPQFLDRLPSILAFAGIGDFIDQPVKLYSWGMINRLAFAICANADADILLIDEALSAGDASYQSRCADFIAAFRRRGSLIFASHDLTQIRMLCDRAIWIDKGMIRSDGAPDAIVRDYQRALEEEPDDGARFAIDA